MNKLTEIKINRFQLNVLLNDEQKEGFDYLLNHGVFCTKCGETCSKGFDIEEIYLNSLNDIKIKGKCNVCCGNVARIIEFGGDKGFFNKANDFRKSIEK